METNDSLRADGVFGSFDELCGLKVRRLENGRCTVECEVTEKLLNCHGIAHGGLLFTIMDLAGGCAASQTGDAMISTVVTQNASATFLRPTKPGLITAEAEIVRRGRRVIVVQICVYDAERKMLTKGDFTYYNFGEAAAK